jgi:hypothetical protein
MTVIVILRCWPTACRWSIRALASELISILYVGYRTELTFPAVIVPLLWRAAVKHAQT